MHVELNQLININSTIKSPSLWSYSEIVIHARCHCLTICREILLNVYESFREKRGNFFFIKINTQLGVIFLVDGYFCAYIRMYRFYFSWFLICTSIYNWVHNDNAQLQLEKTFLIVIVYSRNNYICLDWTKIQQFDGNISYLSSNIQD